MNQEISDFMRKGAQTIPLPLTAKGRRSIPCHPVEEMDTPEIERIVGHSECGMIRTFSEDETFDLIQHLQQTDLSGTYRFFPLCDYVDQEFLVGYEKKQDS